MNALEIIGEVHEELYDTEVRERMGDVIFLGFIKPTASIIPDDFGMYSEESNHRIREILIAYINTANVRAAELGLNTFHSRLAALQNDEIESEEGQFYDDFFGWADPKLFDTEGNGIRSA